MWSLLSLLMFVHLQLPSPQFEVVSIKPNNSTSGALSIGAQPGGRFSAVNVSLKTLATYAFQVRDPQIFGGPGWIDSDRYNIDAVASGTSTNEQMRSMVQALLIERFKLKSHRETRDLPIYELVAGKNGPKMERTKPDAPPAAAMRNGAITYAKLNMAGFARLLTIVLGRTTVDKTNLMGDFAVKLEWAPNAEAIGLENSAATPQVATAPVGPSIFTAVQEQLGLHLESSKVPTEVIVIESVAKPTDN
jgi:uncharacterized protein (TIGR03435 family)